MARRIRTAAGALLVASLATALGGCERAELATPTGPEAREYYTYSGDLDVEVDGNVAHIRAVQSAAQLRRGGRLWAKVGPYILLFSESTRSLFTDYPGLAAVRVTTVTAGGREVASATLRREALNGLTWRRALNIAGRARRDGTQQVTLLENLVQWGEDHTEHTYNPTFTGR